MEIDKIREIAMKKYFLLVCIVTFYTLQPMAKGLNINMDYTDIICIDGITYEISNVDNKKTAVVKIYDTLIISDGSLSIPECIDYDGERYAVMTLTPMTLIECELLNTIHIPRGVIKIYGFAFIDSPNIESITVEEGNPVYDSRFNCNAIIETKTINYQ